MDVQLPDGTVVQGIPDGTTRSQLASRLQKAGMQVPAEWMTPPEKPAPSAREAVHAMHPVTDAISSAVGEPALQLLTGGASQVAGGVAGLARGAGAGAAALVSGKSPGEAFDVGTQEATDTIHAVEEAGTYQPKHGPGRAAAMAIEKPLMWVQGKSGQAGSMVGSTVEETARDLGVSPEAARRAGGVASAATETAVQAVPALALRVASRAVTRARAPELSTAETPPRGAPADVGDVPRGTPPPRTAQEAPGAAQPPGGPQTPTPTAATARAQAYARRIGLDWARLGAGTRAALTTIAEDARALDRLNPEAVKRQALLQGFRRPIPATRGQLTRDPVELRREAIASRTAEGQPIRDVDIEANRELQANLEVLRGRTAGKRGGLHEATEEEVEAKGPSVREPTKPPTQVGEAAQTAAREKAKWSKKGYQALYKAARETEPEAKVPLQPITELLTQNPEIQHLGWVNAWLNKAAKALGGPEGEPVALTEAKLAELHDLRSKANDIARTGGKEGYYAGQVVKAIDQAMESAPEGAAAWRRANQAFKAHQAEFKDQGIVRSLVEQKKGGADRSLALEKTWAKIARGPLDQIRQVKKTLMTGGTGSTRTAGRAAWRDIRGETVNRILEDARNVTATDETERQILTAAALQKSIKGIPRENLEEILGKRTTDELYKLLRASRITRTQPAARVTESGTVSNLLVMADKILGHIPGGIAKTIKGVAERGRAAADVRRATQTPLEEAARRVAPRARRAAQYRAIEGAGPTLGPPGAAPQPPPIATDLSIGAALATRKPQQ